MAKVLLAGKSITYKGISAAVKDDGVVLSVEGTVIQDAGLSADQMFALLNVLGDLYEYDND